MYIPSDIVNLHDREIALPYTVYVETDPAAKFYDIAALFNSARQS